MQEENSERKLKLGHFIVKMKDQEPLYVEPLTQNDLAENWQMVLPKKTKKITKHYFNIYLSQLPSHLWSRVNYNKTITIDDVDYYPIMNDNIYYYNIRQTKNDDKIMKLYKELMNEEPNKDVINELYSILSNEHVKGWLMVRAKSYI